MEPQVNQDLRPIGQSEDKRPNKVAIIILLLAIIFAVGYIYFSGSWQNKVSVLEDENIVSTYEEPIEVINHEHGTLPEGFDASLILEKDAEISESKTLIYANGWTQMIVAYNSANTVEENFKLFGKYSSVNGWIVVPPAMGSEPPPQRVSLSKKNNPNLHLDILFKELVQGDNSRVRLILNTYSSQ